jgi:hypothetical protein
MTSQETKNKPDAHPTYLGQQWLQPGNRRGTIACRGKRRHPGRNHCGPAGRQGKTCMVNAELREAQIRDFMSGRDAAVVDASCRAKGGVPHETCLSLVARPTSRRGANDRTGHLNTSHLTDRVNTGSPKRAPLRRPVRRRSRHSSRTPGVMPGTATSGGRARVKPAGQPAGNLLCAGEGRRAC